ncbi:MAG: VanZ family protein [Nitrospirae bacterium]|nr:VanZ family protein [Nitrospirota bacterium]
MKRFIFLWGPVIFFAGLVFTVSSMSHPIDKDPFRYFDKVAHISEYGLFALLLFRALNGTLHRKSFILLAVVTILIILGYGISDEIHQYFVPARQSDIKDVIADGIGATLAMMTVFIKRRIFG